MAGKISEMSDASALDGSEQLEVVQSGANKKVTVNDLLPVELQGNKIIDLNGNRLTIWSVGTSAVLQFIPDVNGEQINLVASNATGDGNSSRQYLQTTDTNALALWAANFNDGVKLAQIEQYADASESEITYTADNHVFPDLVAKDFANDGAAAVGLVPVGGLYHTSGTLKIRLS